MMIYTENELVPPELVDHPASTAGWDGLPRAVACTNPECGWKGEAAVSTGSPATGKCPRCSSAFNMDLQRHSWGIGSRGPGFHSTKFGQRRKKSLIARSEKLAQTQWDNQPPLSVVNPTRVVNPTPGGPFDPNSKFNKHQPKNTKIIY